MPEAPMGQMWSIGRPRDFKEFSVFLREFYMGLVYTEEMLKWYISPNSVILFCRDNQTGYISGSIVAIPTNVCLRGEKVENCYVINLLCLQSQLRGHGMNKRFFDHLKFILNEKHEKYAILFTSLKKMDGSICTVYQYDRYVSLDMMARYRLLDKPITNRTQERLNRKLYDAILPNFMNRTRKMRETDIPEVLKILNSRDTSDMDIIYDDNSVKKLLPVDDVINTWLVTDDDNKITDLVSYYYLNYCLDKKNEVYTRKAFLLDIVSNKYSKQQLLGLVAHSARVDKCLTFGTMGIDGLDKVSEEHRMTKLHVPLYYYMIFVGQNFNVPCICYTEGKFDRSGTENELSSRNVRFYPYG